MNLEQKILEEQKKKKFKQIMLDESEFQVWEQLENGCSIATMGYSESNIMVLLKLLKSFEEQYGEEIDLEAAKEELELYQTNGKLFIYLDENGIPVSMNGCIYNYDNDTVEFTKDGKQATSLYFYGLSTVPQYRGKGACSALVKYSIDFAKYNGFDIVYARTDLKGSNSEGIMRKHGMELCLDNNMIIAEWVQVTEDKGDPRLHMWKPLVAGVELSPKGEFIYASNDSDRTIFKPNTIENDSKLYIFKPTVGKQQTA